MTHEHDDSFTPIKKPLVRVGPPRLETNGLSPRQFEEKYSTGKKEDKTMTPEQQRGTVRGFLIGVILTAIIATYAHVWFMPEPVVCKSIERPVSAELKTLREDLAVYKEAARLPHGYSTMSTQRLRPPPPPQYKPLRG